MASDDRVLWLLRQLDQPEIYKEVGLIGVRRRGLGVVVLGGALLGNIFANPANAQPEAPSADPAPSGTGEAVSTTVPTAEELDAQIEQLQERVADLERLPLNPVTRGASPGIGANIPTAWGAYKGDLGIGFGLQQLRFNRQDYDAAAGLTFGLGNPSGRTGFEIGFNVLDISRLGRRGSFNFMVHHAVSDTLSVGVGIEDALTYGDTAAVRLDERGTRNSVYGVASKFVRLKEDGSQPFSRAYLTLGVGNNRFLSESKLINGEGGVNVFGGAAFNVSRRANAFAEWTGQDLIVGASIAPFRRVPIVITPALADITGRAGNGARFVLGVGYGFSY